MRPSHLLLATLALLAVVLGQEPSLFAPSRLETASGARTDPEAYFPAADCGECHVDQYAQWKGSLHSRAHDDAIYRAFAELARKEAGEEVYRFCSGCHNPLSVATGAEEPAFLVHEGVTCDVCHMVSAVRTVHAGGGANASFVLEEGETRYGPLMDPGPTPAHESKGSELFRSATLCSACHTLLHPANGLVIENTFEEWKDGPFGKAGVVCQDCHMRTVEQALEVAKGRKPVRVAGRTTDSGEPRPDVHAHLFVGANANGALVGSSDAHAAEAERRLQAATRVELGLPGQAAAGASLAVEVRVTNVAAGHAIPSSITELRQVWIDLEVKDGGGATVFRSGAVDADGRVDPDAIMYHAVLVDADGKVTYRPWRAEKMVFEKLLPPQETVTERYAVPLPAGARGPLEVRAVLRYRSAPQEVLDELFGRGKLPLRIVDMAEAAGAIPVK